MVCFRNFPVAKNFMDKTGGESIRIFCRKKFVSQVGKKLQGNLSVFHQYRLSENVREKRRGWEIYVFPSMLLSQGTERFRRANLLCCV